MKKILAIFMIMMLFSTAAFAVVDELGYVMPHNGVEGDELGTVTYDGTNLMVDLMEGYYFIEAHGDVQDEYDKFPVTQKNGKGKGNKPEKANPKVGHFALQHEYHTGLLLTSLTEEIVILDGYVVAIHVEVISGAELRVAYSDYMEYLDLFEGLEPMSLGDFIRDGEYMLVTGWLEGDDFPGSNWATYATYED